MVDTLKLAQKAADAANGKKAIDVLILDLRGLTTLADFFVICSGASTTQVDAIADGIEQALKEEGRHPSHIEGKAESTWILMDYGDIVVHIFEAQTRAFYALDRLWGDAPRLPLVGRSLQGASS